MALSYIEYDGDGSTTTFITPKYLQEDHLVVTVNGVLKSSPTDYSVSGETITFVDAPLSTARVRIGRKTSQEQRLNDYQDGSLLTADVMDDDANQMFFMAQEAIDTASETNFFSNSFYSSTTTAPEVANLGDLWYDATNKYLKIYNGTQWDRATPSNETLTFTAFETSGSYSYVSVADLNEEVFVFLNGVKQVKGDSLASLAGVDAKDYFPDVQANRIYFNTLASSDVVQVVIAAADVAGRSSTVVETFTAAANQQVFSLAETYVPAINSVSVYVDGARKTLGSDYTETSNTSISFLSPLTGGEEVVCVINEYSTVTEPTSASLVNFTNASNATETVQTTLTSLNTSVGSLNTSISNLEDSKPLIHSVDVTTTSSQSLTAGTPAEITGLSVTLTPKSANSKFLLMANWNGEGSSTHNYATVFGFKRDNNYIGNPAVAGNRTSGRGIISQGYYEYDNATTPDSWSGQYVDEPGTTSEITYKVFVTSIWSQTLYNNRTVSDSDSWERERLTSSLIILEIP